VAKATRIWGWSLVRSRRLNSQGVLRRAELYSGFEAFHLSKCPTCRRRFKVLDNQNSRSVQTLRLFVGLEETCCNVSFRSFDPLSFNQFYPHFISDIPVNNHRHGHRYWLQRGRVLCHLLLTRGFQRFRVWFNLHRGYGEHQQRELCTSTLEKSKVRIHHWLTESDIMVSTTIRIHSRTMRGSSTDWMNCSPACLHF